MATTTENPNQAFIDSAFGKSIMANVVSDIDAALANAKRLQSKSAAKSGGSKELSAWKKDTAALKDFGAAIKDEIKAIKSGSAKSLREFDELTADCGEILEWVEHRNHAYQMVDDAQLEAKIAALMPLLGLLTSDGARALVQKRELEKIIVDLKAAQKTTNSKAAKAVLTATLVIAGTMLPPLGVAGTMFALAATLVASDMGGRAIDYAVGEKSGPFDPLKNTYTLADSSIGAAGAKSKAAEALGKKTAAIAVAWDTTDAGFAYYKKKNLEKRLNALVKDVKVSAAEMEKRAKKIKALQKEAMARLNKARSNAASFSSSKAARKSVQKGFKAYHNMN
jgi:hypothetical protein